MTFLSASKDVASVALRAEVTVVNLCVLGQCLMCPAGKFCGSEGLVEPTGWCAAGFLCLTGVKVPNPTDNKTGSLCPPGSFCQRGLPEGT